MARSNGLTGRSTSATGSTVGNMVVDTIS
jgi:hypothetical protein